MCSVVLRSIALCGILAWAVGHSKPLIAQSTSVAENRTTWNYAEIPWKSSRDEVRHAMERRGLRLTKTTDAGDQFYGGRIADQRAEILALFAEGGLAKTLVGLHTPDEEARGVFQHLRETMIARYGTPTNDYHFLLPPSQEGDRDEVNAIRAGKDTVEVFWVRTAPSGGEEAVKLGISEDLSVFVGYESSQWAHEYERRKAQSTKDF